MELLLNKVCGQPAALPVAVRRCGPADAAAFYALQNEVRAAMPHPEQFVPDTQENITAYLAHDLCLGVFDGERLGAYFILRYCGQSKHNYAAFLGIPQAEWDHWANADSRSFKVLTASTPAWATRYRATLSLVAGRKPPQLTSKCSIAAR